MNKTIFLASGLFLLALVSCGKGYKACVAGFGQCQEMWDEAQAKPSSSTQAGSSTGNLIVRVNEPVIAKGTPTNIEVSGGVAPYVVTFDDGNQNTCDGGLSKQVCKLEKSNESLWKFTARDEAGGVKITVKDANGNIFVTAISVY